MRSYNFSAGPATVPTSVLEQAQATLLDWDGGMSVIEVSHRSKAFIALVEETLADLREVLAVPDNYHVLLLQGGATTQFATVPLNLLRDNTTADYVYTGQWSGKAIAEAKRYCRVNIAASCEPNQFQFIPPQAEWALNPQAAYVHYTPNETIGGLTFPFIPDTGDVPLVADMSSVLFSEPVDVSRYGLIYACGQKNIGPAGLTTVIVRKDLVGHALPIAPSMLDYQSHVDANSCYNTPPTFIWQLTGLVLQWLKAQGGVEQMVINRERKAQLLYQAIDQSDFYHNPIRKDCRSWMNVPFILKDSTLDGEFLRAAEQKGLMNLTGHRSVGGMRASIYNAMPEAGVKALVDFMQEFERRHG